MDRWEKEYVELREDFQDLLDLKDDTETQEDKRNVGDALWLAPFVFDKSCQVKETILHSFQI